MILSDSVIRGDVFPDSPQQKVIPLSLAFFARLFDNQYVIYIIAAYVFNFTTTSAPK